MKRYIAFKSLRTRLTSWFLLVALFPLIIVSIVVYTQRVHSIKTEAFSKLTAIRDLKVQELNVWIDERMGDMQTISQDLEIRVLGDIFKRQERTEEDRKTIRIASDLLNSYKRNYNSYHGLFIVNPVSGKIETSTQQSSVGTDESREPFFTEPMRTGKIHIQDIYYSKALNRTTMSFSIPIYSLSRDNTIGGILVAQIDLDHSLYDLLLARTGMGRTGETLLVNRDGIALNELRWYERAPFRLKIKAKAALFAAQGATGIIETTDYRDEEILAAYTHIPRTRWGFVAKQDLKEVYAPIGVMFWQILIILVISLVGVLLIALFIGRTISRPVLEMAEVAKKIQGGDLSARNRISGGDELASLARSTNLMAEALGSRMKVQTGVAGITETMVRAGEMADFAPGLLKSLIEATNSSLGSFHLRSEDGLRFEHRTSVGINPELLEPFDADLFEGEFGKALSTKEIAHIKDIPEDTRFKFKTFAGTAIPKAIITIPITVNENVMAMVSLGSLNGYSQESLEVLSQAWVGINTAFSNLLATEETRTLAKDLDTKNQELEAQTEELQAQTEELQQQSEELKEQNVELEAQRRQVEEADRLKSEFLSNMSHELRTPLNSVMALSRVLIMQAKEKLTEEEMNYLEIIERNGKQLLALINDILDLSKIEAGRMDVTLKRFSIKSTIEMIVESLEPVAEEKGIEITQEIPDHLPRVENDESRIHQVLQNIIGNGVKFTEEGSVTVSASYDREHVTIQVKDTGIGISEKDLPHIFEEFRQVDGSSSRHYEGTGLGLTISQRAARILGGDITVESTPGKGSLFTVTLPIEWPGGVSTVEPVVMAPSHESRPERKTILVVDDEPHVATMISDYLSQMGYNILTATSGKEALRLAERHPLFAITLDVIMPEMDGWEVLQRLKENPQTTSIPVIIVTAKDLTKEERERLQGNVSSILGKSGMTSSLLLEEIKKILRSIEDHPEPPGIIDARKAKRILMVEDNEAAVIQVRRALEEAGFQVDVARGGEEALDYLQKGVPDGIILDLMMPGVDGFDVLEKMRGTDATAGVPVLILTAKDLTPEDYRKLKANNIQQLIQKGDVDLDELLSKIKKMFKPGPGIRQEPLVKKGKNEQQRGKKYAVPQRKVSGGRPKILVVEDNPDNMMTIKAVLKDQYEILEAVDGEEGLKKTLGELPDLVVLDMALPKMDGFTVVRKIKENKKAGHIPVIALTARAMKGDKEKIIEAGCDDYISKPVDPDGMLQKIREWVPPYREE